MSNTSSARKKIKNGLAIFYLLSSFAWFQKRCGQGQGQMGRNCRNEDGGSKRNHICLMTTRVHLFIQKILS